MNEKVLTSVAIGLIAGIPASLLLLGLLSPRPVPVARRIAQANEEQPALSAENSAAAPAAEQKTRIEGEFLRLTGRPAPSGASWPGFRGPDFNNIARQSGPLLEQWPAAGPAVIWSVSLSEGHSGPSVAHGSVYIMDYDEAKESDVLRRFSLGDGQEIWRRWYRAPTKRNHGVSRAVPAVSDQYAVSMGPRCHVMCVDSESGAFRWGLDLVADFGAEVPLWYTGQCPLIDGETAVIAPAGKDALMLGVDCPSGKILWQTPNDDHWKMSHSSVMPMTLLGKRTYVYCSLGGIVGISAETGDRGSLLWKSAAWTHTVLAPSPVQVDDHRIFLTAGYGGGSMMLGLTNVNGAIQAGPIFELAKTVFACEQQTPVFYEQHLFGVLPKDAGALRGEFVCLDTEGRIAWESGKTERFGLGPYLFADQKVFILNDTGELTLARASTRGYERLARARVLSGRDAWAPMALVEGKLLLRDSEKLICLQVGQAGPKLAQNGN